ADELMRRVWPGLVVSPETVSQRVKLVRQALGDEAAAPRYIAGIRGRGYRLVPPVSVIDGSDPDGRDGTRTDAPPAAGSSDPSRPAQARPAPAPGIPGRGRHPCSLSLVLAVLVLAAALYELGEGTLGGWRSARAAPAAEPLRKSLAVLPFVNLSGDAETAYLGDALSEEILDRLSRNRDLRVAARTSSFAYEGRRLDARELQARLGVRYLLAGSVRREHRHLRVSAELIDESGFRVWSRSYDRKITGLFAVQDEIAASVVRSLAAELASTGEEATGSDGENDLRKGSRSAPVFRLACPPAAPDTGRAGAVRPVYSDVEACRARQARG